MPSREWFVSVDIDIRKDRGIGDANAVEPLIKYLAEACAAAMQIDPVRMLLFSRPILMCDIG